jgi:ABC-type amino acid transport substrate-binding protein
MRRPRTLARIESYPKAAEFLNSVSRTSESSAKSYSFSLSHFQTFLKSKYKDYDVETILTALQENKIDVYSSSTISTLEPRFNSVFMSSSFLLSILSILFNVPLTN